MAAIFREAEELDQKGFMLFSISLYKCDVLAECEPMMKQLPAVKVLDFTLSRFAFDPLAALAASDELETLELAGVRSPPKGWSALRKFPSIRRLSTPRGKDHDETLRHISTLRGLSELSICPASDDGLKYLSGLKELRMLCLCNSNVKGPGLKHIASLSKLDSLVLDGSPVGSDGLKHLGRMENLTMLYADGTNVDDTIGPWLRQQPRISTVLLYNTRVTNAIVEDLVQIPTLCQAGLSEDQISWKQRVRLDAAIRRNYIRSDAAPVQSNECTPIDGEQASTGDADTGNVLQW